MNKAYKFRIYPNETQKILFSKTFGCTRMVYNYYLEKRIFAGCRQHIVTALEREAPAYKQSVGGGVCHLICLLVIFLGDL